MSLSAFELSLKENARILSSPFVFQMFGMLPDNGGDFDNENNGEEDPRGSAEEPSDDLQAEEAAEQPEADEGKGANGARKARMAGAAGGEEGEEAGTIGVRLEDALYELSRGFRSPTGPIFDEEYWRQFSRGLTIDPAGKGAQRLGAGIGKTSRKRRAKEIAMWLKEEGYFVDQPEGDWEIEKEKLKQMVNTIRALKEAGWPSVFAFVFDEVWELFERIWPMMNEVLGGECVLEPSFFVYALENHKLNQPKLKKGTYLGGNFGLPHRDHNHTESNDEDGNPQILSIWIPLNDVDTHNGCMYVVPKEFDEFFDKPEDDSHLKAAMWKKDGKTELRFDLSCGRPLQAKAGSTLGWHGNLIHWGSKCSSKHRDPRVSVTCTFRLQKSRPTHLQGEMEAMTQEDLGAHLTLEQRLRYIAKSLLLYHWWYPMPDHAVPEVFFQ